jgi:hypothetical protein
MTDAIEAQLAACNAQDIDAFCACYRVDVRVENGNGTALSTDIAVFRQKYAALFAREPATQAEVVQCMRVGPWVIDEERITGRSGPDWSTHFDQPRAKCGDQERRHDVEGPSTRTLSTKCNERNGGDARPVALTA